ncbi:MAG TPA: PD-(D/E)XK nuclease family protein [Allosphingosinicella sp.]|jgi:RecB family exonuclease
MMDIVLGLQADAGAWPDHGGTGPGAVGAPVVGPNGLVDILETARGLGSPSTPNVVRIAAFEAALERLDGRPRFWAKSLAVDGWATARTLLSWRDELVGAGWRSGETWANGRLADLAAADAAAADLPPGLADRVAGLLMDLADRPCLPIRRIRLIDPREVHSAGWRLLLNQLERCGVSVEQLAPSPAAPKYTALGRLQRWMIGEVPIQGGPDGTLTIATSASAALAAEVMGQWFAERGDAEAVLIAQDADTHLLDHGLCAAGQPRAGRSRASAHRGSLQILLLAFKIAWTPFDPGALMELLAFPTSPIAPRAARRLAEALEEAPGRGGSPWQEAWVRISEAELAEAGGDPAKLRKTHARLERWQAWVEPELADPVLGMPLAAALAACDRTIAWAGARHAIDGDQLYAATVALAGDVRAALVKLGREILPRTLIERIIDQALDIGHDNPAAAAEAARWRCVPQPGSVWGPVETVVWWNFRTTQEGLKRQPWTQGERDELAASGCPVDDVGLAGRAASAAWERAVLHAQGNLLLIAAGLDSGDDEALHPLAHRLAPATEKLASYIRIEDALATANITVAGVELRRELVPVAPLPQARPVWPAPPGLRERLDGLTHSATSFEAGLGCHFKWALKHVARLRPGRVRSIPDANQLLGNLAHALAQEIFVPGDPPPAGTAKEQAAALLDDLIDHIAAPLRLPELASQLAEARGRLPDAMAELARTLATNELTVEETEKQVSATFENALSVRGAVDLIARDKNGHHVIIDLKWTRSEKKRREELEQGKAVQLATYGAMTAGDQPYRAGYFLLNQRQFSTLIEGGLIGRAVEGARGFPATWAAVRESWRKLGEIADAGQLVACGLEGHDEHLSADLPIMLEANCKWCDYQTLCRVKGLG